MIAVAVSGAAGRMGQTVCAAVEGATDMELVGRADPALQSTLEQVLSECGPEVVVDFSRPDTALANALACVRAGVHVVIGTTGFDLDALREQALAISEELPWRHREHLHGAQLRYRGGIDAALRRGGREAHAQGRDR